MLPFNHFLARFLQHRLPDANDQSGLLGDRNELAWCNQPSLRMCPAHQRLKPGETATFERNDRLIINEEFVALDRQSQITLQPQTRDGPGMHSLVEHLVSGFAVFLCTIHRRVCVAKNIVRLDIAGKTQRNADAGGRESRVLVEHEWLRQLDGNPLGYPHGITGIVDTTKQDGKLVATKSGQDVFRSQALLKSLRKGHEQKIAMRVSQAVINVLEPIEVEK